MKNNWKKSLTALLCGFIALSAGSFVACNGASEPPPNDPGQEQPGDPVALTTPSIRLSQGKATWQQDLNATGYEYQIDDATPVVTQNLFVSLTEGQSCKVRALGDGEMYLDSGWSNTVKLILTKLDRPEVSISGGKAVWTAIPNASGYMYKIDDGAEQFTENLFVTLQAGQSIQVKAVGDGYEYKDGNWSSKCTYIALEVEVLVNIAGAGTVTGGGSYGNGDEVMLTATANEGYEFVRWSDGDTNATRTIVVEGDTTLTAIFAAKVYEITATADATEGTVTGAGSYAYGSTVVLTAVPNEGYHFVKWSDGDTSITKQITVSGNVTLTAEFAENAKIYTVSFMVDGQEYDSVEVEEDGTVTAPAINPSKTGYTFDGWDFDFSTPITQNTEIEAIFTVNTYTVSVSAENGTVTGAGSYAYGSTVVLTAVPNEGYHFVKWSDGDTSITKQITVSGNVTLTAEFAENAKIYTVSFKVDGQEYDSVEVEEDGTVTAPAINPSKTGYTFDGWDFDFSTPITQDIEINALFTRKTYTVTIVKEVAGVTVTDNSIGKVTGDGTYGYGDGGTLTATTVASGYEFKGWYDGDNQLTTDTSYTISNVTANITLKAVWEMVITGDEWIETAGYNYFYFTQLGDDVMPIGAWSSPPPNKGSFTTNQITLANYQVLAESGINVAYALQEIYNGSTATSSANVLKALDYAEQVGVVYMVRDLGLLDLLKIGETDRANTRMQEYASKSAFGGYLMKDEPGYVEFGNLGTATETWYDTVAGSTLNLVNNLPSYADALQLYYGASATEAKYPNGVPEDAPADYEAWVRAYIDTINPQVFSYDFYPFSGQMSGLVHSDYYANMSIVRKVCMEKNIPFWTFAQAGTFDGAGGIDYAQVAIQMNTALAYGAKGVQWFNYWQPLEFEAERECALVDHYGNKTKYYDMVQKVNKQIAAVDHVLMKSKSTGIVQIGASGMGEIPASDKVTSYGALTSAKGIGDAIIGCFEYRDQGYAYYVSSNNFYKGATITLNLDGTYELEKIQDGVSKKVTTNAITVSVPAGEGVLIVVPNKKSTTATNCAITLGNDNASAGEVMGGGAYAAGSEVTVGALAKLGYVFDGWYENGQKVASTEAYTFTASGNRTLTAKWAVDPNPLLLNDFESAGSVDAPYAASTSTVHVFQGNNSVTLTYQTGHYLNIKLLDIVDLATLKSACSQIKLNIYSSVATTLLRKDRVTVAANLVAGDNVVVINTADLTENDLSGAYLTVWTGGACTLYLDNLIGIFGASGEPDTGEVLLNACDTADGFWCNNGAALNTNSAYIVQGSGSVAMSFDGWAPMNVYWGVTDISKYTTVTLTIYSTAAVKLLAGDINYINDPDCILAELSVGKNEVSIPVSKLIKYNLTASICAPYTSGACTLYFDNIVGVL